MRSFSELTHRQRKSAHTSRLGTCSAEQIREQAASPLSEESRPAHQAFPDQKSIWTPILKKRGVKTEVGASHACDPVVAAGLNVWLYVRIAAEFVTL